jgi:acyl carrier protein
MTPFETELAELIIEALNLEIAADAIEPEAPLHGGEGLGLDSIDLLELSVVISRKYGVQLKADDADIADVFGSLSALARSLEARRVR